MPLSATYLELVILLITIHTSTIIPASVIIHVIRKTKELLTNCCLVLVDLLIVTRSGKTGLIDTIIDIYFLSVFESFTHALPRNTKCLIIDGQVCFYRRLFTDTVEPRECISWPWRALIGLYGVQNCSTPDGSLGLPCGLPFSDMEDVVKLFSHSCESSLISSIDPYEHLQVVISSSRKQ